MLLEIDWQGAQQVKKQFHNAVEIFILPPSLDALEDRLKKRGQDEPNVIMRRLLAAGSEMAHAAEAEYVVINENFERALAELQCLVAATRSALRVAIRPPHAAFRGARHSPAARVMRAL